MPRVIKKILKNVTLSARKTKTSKNVRVISKKISQKLTAVQNEGRSATRRSAQDTYMDMELRKDASQQTQTREAAVVKTTKTPSLVLCNVYLNFAPKTMSQLEATANKTKEKSARREILETKE